jgi:hypothetical protein
VSRGSVVIKQESHGRTESQEMMGINIGNRGKPKVKAEATFQNQIKGRMHLAILEEQPLELQDYTFKLEY